MPKYCTALGGKGFKNRSEGGVLKCTYAGAPTSGGSECQEGQDIFEREGTEFLRQKPRATQMVRNQAIVRCTGEGKPMGVSTRRRNLLKAWKGIHTKQRMR